MTGTVAARPPCCECSPGTCPLTAARCTDTVGDLIGLELATVRDVLARLDHATEAPAKGRPGADDASAAALTDAEALEHHVLLLDEPTNHLDAGGHDHLTERLRTHSGVVVLVSHDRQPGHDSSCERHHDGRIDIAPRFHRARG